MLESQQRDSVCYFWDIWKKKKFSFHYVLGVRWLWISIALSNWLRLQKIYTFFFNLLCVMETICDHHVTSIIMCSVYLFYFLCGIVLLVLNCWFCHVLEFIIRLWILGHESFVEIFFYAYLIGKNTWGFRD